MHSDATRSLYAMVERLTALGRSRVLGDPDTIGIMAPLKLLFKDQWTPVRMTEASQRLMISKPAATQAINRLVKQGLLERSHDASDRRVVYVSATPAGRAFFEREINKSLGLADRVIARMGAEEAAELVRLLDLFFDAFDAETQLRED